MSPELEQVLKCLLPGGYKFLSCELAGLSVQRLFLAQVSVQSVDFSVNWNLVFAGIPFHFGNLLIDVFQYPIFSL